MDQGTQSDNLLIGAFSGGNLGGELPDTVDVMPVVPRTLGQKPGFDVLGNARNQIRTAHLRFCITHGFALFSKQGNIASGSDLLPPTITAGHCRALNAK
jgi:hypothetical protein